MFPFRSCESLFVCITKMVNFFQWFAKTVIFWNFESMLVREGKGFGCFFGGKLELYIASKAFLRAMLQANLCICLVHCALFQHQHFDCQKVLFILFHIERSSGGQHSHIKSWKSFTYRRWDARVNGRDRACVLIKYIWRALIPSIDTTSQIVFRRRHWVVLRNREANGNWIQFVQLKNLIDVSLVSKFPF